MPVFLIFIIVPFIELALFATVSEHIGLMTTLFLAFLTAIIGGALVRYQGLHTIFSMRRSMDEGKMPLNEMFDGFCLVAAGALLITPGFLTDTIGFALLLPPVRAALRSAIKKHTRWSAYYETGDMYEPQRPRSPEIIEGEYERLDE